MPCDIQVTQASDGHDGGGSGGGDNDVRMRMRMKMMMMMMAAMTTIITIPIITTAGIDQRHHMLPLDHAAPNGAA